MQPPFTVDPHLEGDEQRESCPPRLRRSLNVDNLRAFAPTSSLAMAKDGGVAGFTLAHGRGENDHRPPIPHIQITPPPEEEFPAQLRPASAQSSRDSRSFKGFAPYDRIISWRGATGMNRSIMNAPSPIEPRPFTREEIEGHGARSKQPVRAHQPSTSSVETAFKSGGDDEEYLRMGALRIRVRNKISFSSDSTPDGVEGLASSDSPHKRQQAALQIPGPSRQNGDPVKLDRSQTLRNSATLGTRPDILDQGKIHLPAMSNSNPATEPSKSPKSPTQQKKGTPSKSENLRVMTSLQAEANRDDAQIYSTAGLTEVLRRVYKPGPLPAEVLAALPPDQFTSALNTPTTPPFLLTLEPKDRNYITYYIDMLIQRNNMSSTQIQRLEEDVENQEVQKAGMQATINEYYASNQHNRQKLDCMQGLVTYLISQLQSDGEMQQARHAAQNFNLVNEMEAAIRAMRVQAAFPGARAPGADKDEKIRRLETGNRYWRARAEAAEVYVHALE